MEKFPVIGGAKVRVVNDIAGYEIQFKEDVVYCSAIVWNVSQSKQEAIDTSKSFRD